MEKPPMENTPTNADYRNSAALQPVQPGKHSEGARGVHCTSQKLSVLNYNFI